MPGLGQPLLPKPQFHSQNPYWWDPRTTWTFLRPELRPRPSAIDFLNANVWEIWRPDYHMAHLVRQALVRTIRINWYIKIAQQVKAILNQGEKSE